ncbi:trimeric LpxA-like protein, partial [Eremomyces bilateralis CBS 781.70]
PYVKASFWCDYGTNLHIGRTTFINRGCMILDTPVQPIRIGEKCLFGPEVHIYAVSHAEDREEVNSPSYGKQVTIGDRCWIGGRATILGGVSIGDGCIIGAGSVVTKSVPAGHIAYGTPARVYRKVSTSDQKRSPPPLTSGIPVDESSFSNDDLGYASLAAAIALVLDGFLNPGSYIMLDDTQHSLGPSFPWLIGRLRFAFAAIIYLTLFFFTIRMYRLLWS